MTNSEYLRSLTDEELTLLLTASEYEGQTLFGCPVNDMCRDSKPCRACFAEWLKAEHK